MKIAIIGASGNLGSCLVDKALSFGHEVVGFVHSNECKQDIKTIHKSLFDLTREDLQEFDVVLSAFGSGFNTNPIINKQAFEKYIELLNYTNIRLLAIAGAGSLYSDASHSCYEYMSPNHPEKLREISKNIRFGVDEIQKVNTFDWVVVCPSRFFDLNGPDTNDYMISDKEEVLFNEEGESYLSYLDMADAMLNLAENHEYSNKIITVVTRKTRGGDNAR